MLRQGTKILILIAYLMSTLTASGVAIGNFIEQGDLDLTIQSDDLSTDSAFYSATDATRIPGSVPAPGPCEIEYGSDEDDVDDEPVQRFTQSSFVLQPIAEHPEIQQRAVCSKSVETGCPLFIKNQVFRI